MLILTIARIPFSPHSPFGRSQCAHLEPSAQTALCAIRPISVRHPSIFSPRNLLASWLSQARDTLPCCCKECCKNNNNNMARRNCAILSVIILCCMMLAPSYPGFNLNYQQPGCPAASQRLCTTMANDHARATISIRTSARYGHVSFRFLFQRLTKCMDI